MTKQLKSSWGWFDGLVVNTMSRIRSWCFMLMSGKNVVLPRQKHLPSIRGTPLSEFHYIQLSMYILLCSSWYFQPKSSWGLCGISLEELSEKMNKAMKTVAKVRTSRWRCHETHPYYFCWSLLYTFTCLLENLVSTSHTNAKFKTTEV